MRKVVVGTIAFVAGLSMAVVPSLGANQSVTATPFPFSFSPKTVTVAVGESVTWTNGGGDHNVKFDDGSFTQPPTTDSSAWQVSRTFTTGGTFTYYCELHKDVGMTGTVVVTGGATAPGGGGGTGTNPPTTVLDKIKPQVRLSGAGTQKVLDTGALAITLRVDEKSTVTGNATITVPGASKVLKLRKITRSVDASGPAKLKWKLSRKVRRSVASALKKRSRLKARISIVAKDAAGNSRTSRRTVKIKK